MADQDHEKKDNTTFEDEELRLQLNKKERNSSIQYLDATPKQSCQDWLTKPTLSTQKLACIKDKTSASTNVICSISAFFLVCKFHIYIVIVLANLKIECDYFGLNKPLFFRETIASPY